VIELLIGHYSVTRRRC